MYSSYSFYILSGLAFPGNRTHHLGVANAMLYQLSYRKAVAVAFTVALERLQSSGGMKVYIKFGKEKHAMDRFFYFTVRLWLTDVNSF